VLAPPGRRGDLGSPVDRPEPGLTSGSLGASCGVVVMADAPLALDSHPPDGPGAQRSARRHAWPARWPSTRCSREALSPCPLARVSAHPRRPPGNLSWPFSGRMNPIDRAGRDVVPSEVADGSSARRVYESRDGCDSSRWDDEQSHLCGPMSILRARRALSHRLGKARMGPACAVSRASSMVDRQLTLGTQPEYNHPIRMTTTRPPFGAMVSTRGARPDVRLTGGGASLVVTAPAA